MKILFEHQADTENFEATPLADRLSAQTTYDIIRNTAHRVPDNLAFKFQFTAAVDEQPIEINYQAFLQRINQTANALHATGVSIGGATSFILPNLPQTLFSIFGAEALGIAGPINSFLEPAALRDICIASESQALVILGPTPNSEIWEKSEQILDQIPSLKVVLQVNLSGDGKATKDKTEGGIPILDFNTWVAQQNGDSLDFEREIKSTDIAAYFHTGGTTGTPKLAQHTHANQVFMASICAQAYDMGEDTVAICGLPLFHVNAVFASALNLFSCGGQTVLLTPGGFRTPGVINNLWQLVAKYRGSYFSCVPTIISALMSSPSEKVDLSSMRFIFCGAAPISAELMKQFMDKFGIQILELYGMTEGTAGSSANNLMTKDRIGSIGIRLPYQQMKCIVLDEDDQYVRDCAVNEPGMIVLKGPNVFPGYKQQDKNKGVFIDGWLVSGDIGRQDEKGLFWLTGRAKDLIIRGGHNIDPKAIEDALSDHPHVELVAAIGQPDSYAGELPCAYVTLTEGQTVSEDELLKFAKDNIVERAACPVYVEVVKEMPVTAVGKIFKPSLRKLATKRVLDAAIQGIDPELSSKIEDSKLHGLIAIISGGEKNPEVKNALDAFAIKYEFE